MNISSESLFRENGLYITHAAQGRLSQLLSKRSAFVQEEPDILDIVNFCQQCFYYADKTDKVLSVQAAKGDVYYVDIGGDAWEDGHSLRIEPNKNRFYQHLQPFVVVGVYPRRTWDRRISPRLPEPLTFPARLPRFPRVLSDKEIAWTDHAVVDNLKRYSINRLMPFIRQCDGVKQLCLDLESKIPELVKAALAYIREGAKGKFAPVFEEVFREGKVATTTALQRLAENRWCVYQYFNPQYETWSYLLPVLLWGSEKVYRVFVRDAQTGSLYSPTTISETYARRDLRFAGAAA